MFNSGVLLRLVNSKKQKFSSYLFLPFKKENGKPDIKNFGLRTEGGFEAAYTSNVSQKSGRGLYY